MVNSGTEATMSAIRVARGFTGAKKIIKFDGCWHGHADGLLVKAGSTGLQYGVRTAPEFRPDTPPALSWRGTMTSAASVRLLDAHPARWLRFIVEPVAGTWASSLRARGSSPACGTGDGTALFSL